MIMVAVQFLYGKLLGEMEVYKDPSLFITCWVEAESLTGGGTGHDKSSSKRDLSNRLCVVTIAGCMSLAENQIDCSDL